MSTVLSQSVKAKHAGVTLSDEERQPCEIWTRVMGYHRPVSSFNTGKKGEFHERKYFSEREARLAH
ncbi:MULTISPECIES: anaerobic ribonucleoside-triphosphate reductase [unclassified Paraburkholderia]|uniref:anaerobic ribonucleoside-triphosphate reductase n=1 Tax=unclassified Paraburkholderia TaxID=2615204 RepID=UPI0020B74371|nr:MULTISPECIES: anaerobic ribonucleoside-triphosphate reductase [unclassified Paraburkholderia]MCP3720493.1 anaerobic ribonucleoside-triphosphate reductase [Paraburkholderia sp. CNPSo 3281]MCX5543081.1 anaerobic ribonucleoside-triphosphate reductase [Paraburkholderia sp. CNPSo 3076]